VSSVRTTVVFVPELLTINVSPVREMIIPLVSSPAKAEAPATKATANTLATIATRFLCIQFSSADVMCFATKLFDLSRRHVYWEYC
jgi:hypothetical protein